MNPMTFLALYLAFRLFDATCAMTWRAIRTAWYRWYYRHSPYKGWGGSVHIQAGKRAESIHGAKDGAIFILYANGEVAAQFGDPTRRPYDTDSWKPKTWWGAAS